MENKEITFFDNMKAWPKPNLYEYLVILVERIFALKEIVEDPQEDKKKREKAAIILTKLSVRYENVLFRFNNYEIKEHEDFKMNNILMEEIKKEEQNYINLKRKEPKKWKLLLKKQSLKNFFSTSLFKRPKKKK